jgi:glutathione reductase (NADPH)
MPKIPGIEHAINSDGFFDIETQPKKAVVVGAGYIAVELAGIFHALGTETTLMVRHNEPLRNFDQLIRETLVAEMKESGPKLLPESHLKEVTRKFPRKFLYIRFD